MKTLNGTGSTPLSGVGTARWYRSETTLSLPTRPDPTAVDHAAEQERFDAARESAREAIQHARSRAEERIGEPEAGIFDTHEAFLDDPELVSDITAAIDDGTPAEHAVDTRFAAAIEQFEQMDGPMADRADDLRDVRDRVLRALLDVPTVDLSALPPGTVLLAERLTPSNAAGLDPDAIAGIATITGGRTSHAAIIARSLSIPAVVGVGDPLSTVSDGETVLVDGDAGAVVLNPDAARRASVDDEAITAINEAVTTVDGRPIEVAANVGSEGELAPACDRGADGIGLFRTEFLFLDRDTPPSENEQYRAVKHALEAFPNGRVVVRTVDIGGDKDVPYLELPTETNPFLGQRGIRLSLNEHADLFETQLRALLRAAAVDTGGQLAVMIPMATRTEEVSAVITTIESVAADLEAADVDHAIPELGAMIETPAAASLADVLAKQLDFLSVGTNDLTQYVMAADRENDTVADYHDPLHPAVIRTVHQTTAAAADTDAWVGMCGEMAGDPAVTELLVGLGLDELSMSAVTVPAVKRQVREIDAGRAETLAANALACDTRAGVRELLDG